MALERIEPHIEFDGKHSILQVIEPNQKLAFEGQPESWMGRVGRIDLDYFTGSMTFLYPRTGQFITPNDNSLSHVADEVNTPKAGTEGKAMALVVGANGGPADELTLVYRPTKECVRLMGFRKNGEGWNFSGALDLDLSDMPLVFDAPVVTNISDLLSVCG